MNKWLIFLLSLFLCSCAHQDKISSEVDPPLTISAFIYDGTIEKYVLTPLEEGVVYDNISNSAGEMLNINLHLLCEGGSIRIVSEDHEVQLSIGDGAEIFRSTQDERLFGYDFEIINEGYVAVIPYGSAKGEFNFVTSELSKDMDKTKSGYLGKEYRLIVYGYELGHQVVKAELLFTQLEDPNFSDTDMSGRFSIEMTSYEYSYRYKLMLE